MGHFGLVSGWVRKDAHRSGDESMCPEADMEFTRLVRFSGPRESSAIFPFLLMVLVTN